MLNGFPSRAVDNALASHGCDPSSIPVITIGCIYKGMEIAPAISKKKQIEG